MATTNNQPAYFCPLSRRRLIKNLGLTYFGGLGLMLAGAIASYDNNPEKEESYERIVKISGLGAVVLGGLACFASFSSLAVMVNGKSNGRDVDNLSQLAREYKNFFVEAFRN